MLGYEMPIKAGDNATFNLDLQSISTRFRFILKPIFLAWAATETITKPWIGAQLAGN
jgi:hypothetical protein